ncbi:hypothetical protein DM01DRAFT_1336141 [Hesseltinella vesiculosa]|uniref:Protein N-terminal and lysine N-methyltransferase EFM7 n=1 Tax=Hesseltinella vesiculosa TaxID=101127 RepID=A0A1X2GH70_9FUNG|nr:hypothetical protein DM01DRAFT_1336141 [Hesseltinella vesiculosa]
MASSDEEGFAGDMFGEESDTVEVAPSTFEIYERQRLDHQDPLRKMTIQLVGSHPLWAHHLWNASKVFADLFDKSPELVQGKTVLELGAGGALPSLVAALQGASKVVVTDYPDQELLDNIQHNVDQNVIAHVPKDLVVVKGFIWGTAVDPLRQLLPAGHTTFDVIILSDLVFNHSQHHSMLKSCRELLTPKTGRVYVFYTHHRPHLAHRDLDFFTLAERPVSETEDPDDRDTLGYGFKADHFMIEKMHVMFEEDPGDEQVRSTVHGWQLWLP